jgi:Icc-related predicted phosphoesterase
MTSITCISDTHEAHASLGKLGGGDILIHAGDLTFLGRHKFYRSAVKWMREQPYKHVVVIAGNHDITLQSEPQATEKYFDEVHYLNENSVDLEGLKIYGTPWSPWFNGDRWVFNMEPGDEKRFADEIPEDTDILVTHGPPANYGDRCADGRRVGSVDLLKRIEEIRPKLVVCGHIHEDYGVFDTPWGTKIVNASVLNLNYQCVNAPVTVEL